MKVKMSARDYLKRIGFGGKITRTAETLAELQRCHMMSVPYESIDIWRGKAGPLTYEAMYDKIVRRRRGGYCFELNGMFGWLLRELGFKTEEYFGRWLMDEKLEIPARRHRVIRVTIGKREFIADVGVGQRAPLTPLEFVCGKVQRCEGVDYRIVRDRRLGYVQEARLKGVWTKVYSFDLAPQEPIDFMYVHYFCVNAPDSFFRGNLIVHLPTENGRKSIRSVRDPKTGRTFQRLAVTGDDGKTVLTDLRTERALAAAFAEHFGIRE